MDACSTTAKPAAAMEIMKTKATNLPTPATQEIKNPYCVALATDRRLFGPGAMFSAKHVGTKKIRVWRVMVVWKVKPH